MKKQILLFLLVAALGVALVFTGCEPPGAPIPEAEENGEVQEQVAGGVITGIDPGAGIMAATESAIETYGLDYELLESSDAAMTAALADAIANNEEIIVTGWAPHWKFGAWDLKFLEDPKLEFGEAETINTIVRQGLAEDAVVAYGILDSFFWGDEEIATVMDMNAEGMDPNDSARQWVDENPGLVAQWVPEGAEGEGKIIIGYVTWDCATASTYVMKTVLEDVGYEVEVLDVSAGLMYEGLAEGNLDVITTAWLPFTHSNYMEQVGDRVEDLGSNYEGARIGLVVPAYMDIDSIEDL